MSGAVRWLLVWLGATAIALTSSCQDATEVVARMRTNVPYQTGMSVALTAGRPSGLTAEPNAIADEPWSPDGQLGTLVIAPDGDRSAPLEVVVVLGVAKATAACSIDAPSGCIVARRRLRYLPHRSLGLPIMLATACIGVKCSEDETCNRLGQCVPATVDPESCTQEGGCFIRGESLVDTFEATADAGDTGAHAPDAAPDAASLDNGSLVLSTSSHTCARWADGRVKCWGPNYYGELGLGDFDDHGDRPGEMGIALPFVDVAPGLRVTSVTTNGFSSCAVVEDGRAKCWGDNPDGQLGLGDTSPRGRAPGEMGSALPYVDLGDGRTVKALAAGQDHVCALLDNDRVKCWGNNFTGQLGLGDRTSRGLTTGQMGNTLPYVNLGSGRTVKAMAAGLAFNCAVLDNDRVKCWGQNGNGQLGIGNTVNRGDDPGEMGDALPYVDLGPGRTVKQLATSNGSTCAVLDNDRVKCWGENDTYGQLGLGDTRHRGMDPSDMGNALPYVDLGAGRTVRAVSVGGLHACALLDNARMKCWGRNFWGELGLGDNQNRGDGVGPMGDALPYVDLGAGRTVRSISAGSVHTCAVLDDKHVKCWGHNETGSLGLGDEQARGGTAGQMGDALPAVDLGR